MEQLFNFSSVIKCSSLYTILLKNYLIKAADVHICTVKLLVPIGVML